jgi:hypothetical protein
MSISLACGSLDRLSAFVNHAKADAPQSTELAEVRADLHWSGEFDPARFASRLAKYRVSLGDLAR